MDVAGVLLVCLVFISLWYIALAIGGICGAVNAWWRG